MDLRRKCLKHAVVNRFVIGPQESEDGPSEARASGRFLCLDCTNSQGRGESLFI